MKENIKEAPYCLPYDDVFLNQLESLEFDKGVYVFVMETKDLFKPIYIGQSQNIKKRVLSSIKEQGRKLSSCEFEVWFEDVYIIPCKSNIDLRVLEPLLINKLKPLLNKEYSVEVSGELSLDFNLNKLTSNFVHLKTFSYGR